jgi:putative zinc ribbon protein
MPKRHPDKPRYQREPEAPAQPEVPRNRIAADLSRQAPNNSYSPPTFYEDMPFTCVDCGAEELWTAEQQKWWYEEAKGPVQSTAVRCRACRQARRETHQGTPRRPHVERRKEDA